MTPIDSMAISILVSLIVGILVMGFVRRSHWNRKASRLPPGSMGWPLVGHTLSIIKAHPITTFGDFMSQQLSRHGKIFMTSFLGRLTVVSADPELNRFVLQNEMKLFEQDLPSNFFKLVGKSSIILSNGDYHKYRRSILLNFFSIKKVQTKFFDDVYNHISMLVSSWKEDFVILAREEARKLSFNLMARKTLSLEPKDPETEMLMKDYETFSKGLLSFPLNLPGSACRKGIQASTRIQKYIKQKMEERAKEGAGDTDVEQEDILGWLMKNTTLPWDDISVVARGVIVTGLDTVTRAMVLAIYFLGHCPRAVEQLREEHLDALRSKKLQGEAKLAWDDCKGLKFTQCVISETLRLGNIAVFLQKKACEDIEFKGYLIPRGASVIAYLAAVHLDPSLYEEPEKFNPWRWLGTSNLKSTNDFMPFGAGPRYCIGAELAKMEMTLFLHHLILNYNWEFVEPDHPVASPHVNFPKGLPIKLKALPCESKMI